MVHFFFCILWRFRDDYFILLHSLPSQIQFPALLIPFYHISERGEIERFPHCFRIQELKRVQFAAFLRLEKAIR